jgi:hypothetical protein
MKVSSCVLGGILTLLGLCATSCSTSDPTAPTASNSGKYYAVSVKQAEFYLYGPQQGNGPDRKLPQDTLMMLIRPSFGYSKVQLMNGQQGYVASQDIRAAPPQLVSAETPPMVPPTNRTPKFRFDPRSIPPEPLPNDAPEPTPIPETEASPSP